MSKQYWLKKTMLFLVLFASLGGLISCVPPVPEGTEVAEAVPRAWIDFPRDGAVIPVGASVTVVSHAYAEDGVAEVLLSVNGTAYRRDPPSAAGDTLVEVRQEWVPTEPGLHTLEVRAYDAAGEVSGSDAITVRVTGEAIELPTEVPPATGVPTEVPAATATPVPTDTPPPTATPVPTLVPTLTPTPVPPPQVSFWVDDDSIATGDCTTLHWEVSWTTFVSVNGTEVAGTGTWSVCPASTTTYTIHAEGPGGSVDQSITVNVSAPADTTPPPVPTPYVPADGLMIDPCPASGKQTLVWLPVTDPSGPVVYYVKLEWKKTATEWQVVGGYGPLSDKQVEVDVDCGGIYRWAVRAEDGAGNISAWSEWFTFSINLT
jgi:hypothetical protein